MAYFPDLTKYAYFGSEYRACTLNVGWLDAAHAFQRKKPAPWLVKKLWAYSQYSVAQARGIHLCEFPDCPGPFQNIKPLKFQRELPPVSPSRNEFKEFLALTNGRIPRGLNMEALALFNKPLCEVPRQFRMQLYAQMPGDSLRLYPGSAEIRVFGKRGKIYAAPTLLFHYVTVHHYKPPDEFLMALKEGPCPPEPEYFARLEALGLKWSKTSSSATQSRAALNKPQKL
jgi:hypothetical protein